MGLPLNQNSVSMQILSLARSDVYRKPLKTIYYGLLLLAMMNSICIDVRTSLPMPADMRNRLVGARMMKDGLSPYFYIWKTGGPERYYDTYVGPNAYVSLSTSTPFFHAIMGSLFDMPQYQINIIWMIIQYMCLIGCVLLAVFSLPERYRNHAFKIAAFFAVLFSYTDGWRIHIHQDQNYIFIPLLALACFYCIQQKNNVFYYFLFAMAATSMILLRPITVLFFTPLVFYPLRYYKMGVATSIALVVYIIFVWFTPIQKQNWTEYFQSMKVHIENHQSLKPILPPVANDPISIKNLEGVSIVSGYDSLKVAQLNQRAENSNFFIFYNKITGGKISILAMSIMGVGLGIILLLPMFVYIKRKVILPSFLLFILGFAVYNTYEFFTPVTRLAYHWVQILFPILLVVVWQRKIYLLPLIFLLLGMLLSMGIFTSIKMVHNLGEGLVMLALLYCVYRPLWNRVPETEPLSVKRRLYYV